MSDPVHWVGVDFGDSYPTEEEMENLADIISDKLDNAILTTREIEPMRREEREKYVEELVSALED